MNNLLNDIDELIISCRDPLSKKYISEASICYKVGAFRSGVVITWIAVLFDLINKIRELSLSGDKEAERIIQVFDNAIEKHDVNATLKFEREVLDRAKDNLQIITYNEYIDLLRIQEDRNRCAHPSMLNDVDVFNPSGELLRGHIINAIRYLLIHPPAQGKAALSKVLLEIDSEYFPVELGEVDIALNKTPFYKSRASLKESLIDVLFKNIALEDKGYKYKNKVKVVLQSLMNNEHEIYLSRIKLKISEIVRRIENPKEKYIDLLSYIPGAWQGIDEALRITMRNYVKDIPSENITELEYFVKINDFHDVAAQRISRISRQEALRVSFFVPGELISMRLIDIYANSNDFADANSFYRVIHDLFELGFLSANYLETLLSKSFENNQVYNSNNFPKLLRMLRNVEEEGYQEIVDRYISQHGHLMS